MENEFPVYSLSFPVTISIPATIYAKHRTTIFSCTLILNEHFYKNMEILQKAGNRKINQFSEILAIQYHTEYCHSTYHIFRLGKIRHKRQGLNINVLLL